MKEDIIKILVICVFTSICWAINNYMNPIPSIKQILGIIIIGVGILFLISPVCDVITIALHSAK